MEYIKLGKSGLQVSRICFGCAPMGGHDYGEVDDHALVSAVRCALDHGINFFDAAAIYGFGRAETLLARSLAGQRDKVVLATKGGLRKTENKIVPDLSAAFLRSDIENSLKRLQSDHIDLYQLHYPDPGVPAEDYAGILRGFIDQGKIRAVGLSNFSKAEAARLAAVLPVACLQLPYNPLQRALEVQGIPEFCVAENVGLITHSSLARGYLSGRKYTAADFRGSDTRPRSAYFDPEWDEIKKPVLEMVERIASGQKKTPAQAALRWLLDKPFVSAAIVGIKSSVQVLDAVGACGWHIPDQSMKLLDEISTVFKVKPLY